MTASPWNMWTRPRAGRRFPRWAAGFKCFALVNEPRHTGTPAPASITHFAAAAQPRSTASRFIGRRATPSSSLCGPGTSTPTAPIKRKRFSFQCMTFRFSRPSACTGKKCNSRKTVKGLARKPKPIIRATHLTARREWRYRFAIPLTLGSLDAVTSLALRNPAPHGHLQSDSLFAVITVVFTQNPRDTILLGG